MPPIFFPVDFDQEGVKISEDDFSPDNCSIHKSDSRKESIKHAGTTTSVGPPEVKTCFAEVLTDSEPHAESHNYTYFFLQTRLCKKLLRYFNCSRF